jgi:hypothetical protein
MHGQSGHENNPKAAIPEIVAKKTQKIPFPVNNFMFPPHIMVHAPFLHIQVSSFQSESGNRSMAC